MFTYDWYSILLKNKTESRELIYTVYFVSNLHCIILLVLSGKYYYIYAYVRSLV